jgi:DNA-binding GntR family transcriptional regulator
VEYLKDAENRYSLITEHDELWKSLKRKDVEAADAYMKRHIERQMINIRSSLHECGN